jgi:hypothetical protein
MNERQKLAYENPLARASGDARPFWDRVWRRGRSLSTILTVNK